MPAYPELEISLHTHQGGTSSAGVYTVALRFSQPGSQTETHLHAAHLALATLDDAALQAAASEPGANPGGYGQALAAALFADPWVRVSFYEALNTAHTLHLPLRLRLHLDPTALDLHKLRWESLLDLENGAPLFCGEDILFSRYLSADRWEAVTLRPVDALRALVVIANPADLSQYKVQGRALTPVPVQAELERVRQNLAGVALTELASGGKASLAGIRQALLSDEYDMLYLVCHGALIQNEPWLWLEDPAGKLQRVLGQELVQCLSELRTPPRLVVLLSCQSVAGGTSPGGTSSGGETGGQTGDTPTAARADWGGRALSALGPRLVMAGVPAVLAMQGNISLPAAAAFMPLFFRQLLRHGEIDRAMGAARAAIRNAPDAWMPVLFSRLKDNLLFTPAAQAGFSRQPFEPETVYIPAGVFQMGASAGPDTPAYEAPQHPVDLPAYRIGAHPVTNAQWAEFIRQTGRLAQPELGWAGQNPRPEQLQQPVSGVTWYEARQYCQWLSQRSGHSYSLPTEAQWEKAARGADGRRYPWGNDWQPGQCAQGQSQLPAVGQLATGPYGGSDWVGSVRQWTLSLWGEKRLEPHFRYPWDAADGRNDPAANAQVRRVYRGSAAQDPAAACRCTARGSSAPDQPGPPGKRFGFRVVIHLEEVRHEQ